MAAYLIGQISVRDPARWQTYVAGVGASLAQHGAEIVFRGERAAVLAGEMDKELAVVIRFEDHAALLRWHASPDYQRLVPVRDQAAEVVLTAYRELS